MMVFGTSIFSVLPSYGVFLSGSDQQAKEPKLEFLSVKLFYDFLFDTHLLEDGQTESLRDTTICAVDISRDDL